MEKHGLGYGLILHVHLDAKGIVYTAVTSADETINYHVVD